MYPVKCSILGRKKERESQREWEIVGGQELKDFFSSKEFICDCLQYQSKQYLQSSRRCQYYKIDGNYNRHQALYR